MVSITRLNANRANALKSTGPVTSKGKASVSNNAVKHGLASAKLLLEGESSEEFAELQEDVNRSLHPVGATELALAERVAITIWRQRRLAMAEAAALSFARQPEKIAGVVNLHLSLRGNQAVDGEDLEPFSTVQLAWCTGVLQELGWVQPDMPLTRLPDALPLIYVQLKEDAEEAELSIEQFLANTENGLKGYTQELDAFCRKELEAADRRPRVLELAEVARQRRLVLEPELLELFARYQTTLDNQLLRLLKALRQAQSWRLQTLDLCNSSPPTAIDANET